MCGGSAPTGSELLRVNVLSELTRICPLSGHRKRKPAEARKDQTDDFKDGRMLRRQIRTARLGLRMHVGGRPENPPPPRLRFQLSRMAQGRNQEGQTFRHRNRTGGIGVDLAWRHNWLVSLGVHLACDHDDLWCLAIIAGCDLWHTDDRYGSALAW